MTFGGASARRPRNHLRIEWKHEPIDTSAVDMQDRFEIAWQRNVSRHITNLIRYSLLASSDMTAVYFIQETSYLCFGESI